MHNLIISLFLVIATGVRQSHPLEDGSNELFCPLIQQARLELLCGGIYNIDLFLKYKDALTSISAPYKIFYHIETGFYFLLVSFNESPVQSCNSSIQLNDDLDFFCGDDESPLRLPNSQIFCHRNIMSYVDDLMFECTQPRVTHFLNGQWQGEAAIHYAPRTKGKSRERTHKLASAAGRPRFCAMLSFVVYNLVEMRFCSMFVLLYIVRKLEKPKSGCDLQEGVEMVGSSTQLPQTTISQGRQNRELFRILLKIVPK